MLFKIGLVNKSSVQTIKDTTTFYTSDTELWLGFELLETELIFDSAEILLLNKDDRSFIVKSVKQEQGKYWYELESDIIAHHGEWLGQLLFNKDEEAFTSKKFGFRIENDLSNDRPPQLTEVNNWKNLRNIADGLIDDLRVELESLVKKELEIENAETTRQNAEQQRVEAEILRVERDSERETEIVSIKKDVERFGNVKLSNLIDYNSVVSTDFDLNIIGTEITAKVKNLSSIGNINFPTPVKIAPPNKYYARLDVGVLYKTYSSIVFGGYISTAVTNNLVAGQEVPISAISQPTSQSSVSMVRFTHQTNTGGYKVGDEIRLENAVVIDLTQSFGAGNEPTKEVMDWIIKENGYFDELTLRRDDIQQYEINQLRKAVIALGGTI